MLKGLKKILTVIALTLIAGTANLFAQQITRFAVVDTSRVYKSYYRDTAPVRNYEAKQAEFQTEINKRTQELQNLHDSKVECEQNGEEAKALKIEAEIIKKTEYLQEYTSAKNVELESLYHSLQSNDAFYKKLQNVLGKIAESNGYTMVLNLQEYNAILWYSPSVDITDEVIAALGLSN